MRVENKDKNKSDQREQNKLGNDPGNYGEWISFQLIEIGSIDSQCDSKHDKAQTKVEQHQAVIGKSN